MTMSLRDDHIRFLRQLARGPMNMEEERAARADAALSGKGVALLVRRGFAEWTRRPGRSAAIGIKITPLGIEQLEKFDLNPSDVPISQEVNGAVDL